MRSTGLLARFKTMGFEGPFYRGARGKLRFLIESAIWRREFLFLGTRDSLATTATAGGPPLRVLEAKSFDELERYRSQLDADYYPGFLENWRRPFSWGESVVLALANDEVAAFAWIQRGSKTGFPTYYSRLLEDEARILRVGVVPRFRRQGINSQLMRACLQRLIGEGFGRVYAESHKYNVPSVRTFLKAGFRIDGLMSVLSVPGSGERIRWSSPSVIDAHLREIGITDR